jgi:hypothetical protein
MILVAFTAVVVVICATTLCMFKLYRALLEELELELTLIRATIRQAIDKAGAAALDDRLNSDISELLRFNGR